MLLSGPRWRNDGSPRRAARRAAQRRSVMQQKATNPLILSYGKALPNRRWQGVVFVLGGGVAQFVMLLGLSFSREVRWVDRAAWVLEFPLFCLVWALDLPVPSAAFFPLGLLNGLCWSVMVFACVRLLRAGGGLHRPAA